ncbi:nucleotidyltransferase family protein [Calorimonas adulescens]|jgi:nucleotidyltransferase|uniref:NDP-sugar synthase n=1 Tax=Calorimonas adulescens TaxID=2606906 RepID=A0A5D8QCN3_9THEO|nr:NDP-sugar synthase [Calorimonas adulescens]TZE82435.1 NDP-sugar synthase [Calorimonas adulescens]
MKALLLAGGKGTRLYPLTHSIPKPMVPVLNKPLLERTINYIKGYGIDEIVMSLCYQPEQIMNYFKDGSRFGVKIYYCIEESPLGTGGAIKNAERYLDDTFLIFNSDIITDINLRDLIDYHMASGARVTIALTRVDNPSAYGLVETDNDGRITAFKEKPRPEEITTNFINAGIYVFERDVLDFIPAGREVSVEKEVYPGLLSAGVKMYAYKNNNYWIDIGTPHKYLELHNSILDGLFTYPFIEMDYKNRIVIGKNSYISPTAKLIPPIAIGDNCYIGNDVIIGPRAVIGNNIEIGPGSYIRNSIIWEGCKIGSGSKLSNTIIGINCTIGDNKDVSYGVIAY